MNVKKEVENTISVDDDGTGITGNFDDLIGSGIPGPVRRNLFKTFSRLCTAAVDIPVAYLEGKAELSRSETEARKKMIETSANKMASSIEADPAYVRAAFETFGQRIIRDQKNLDAIIQGSVKNLSESKVDDNNSTESPKEISDDFLNHFEREAAPKSSEEMRLLFGKILAGEITNPGSFSVKTLKIIGEFDAQIALLFQKLCSCAIYLRAPNGPIVCAQVISIGGDAGQNSLGKYGLHFDALNKLHEYGLIISDFNSYFDYRLIFVENKPVGIPFTFEGKRFFLKSDKNETVMRIHGVQLSGVGTELLSIIELVPVPDYANDLNQYFRDRNLNMIFIDGT